MFQRILVGYDGSEWSKRAVRLAADIAQQYQAELRVVYCFDPVPSYLGDPDLQRVVARRTVAGEEIVAEALALIPEGMKAKAELLEGPAAEAIIEVARVRESNLIVLGTRGLGRLSSLLMGSVSHTVVAHAPCPVLVVR